MAGYPRRHALSTHHQALLRRFLDGTRMKQLAADNGIGKSTGYDYLPEGIDVFKARAPGLHGALLAAKAAGYSHVNIDGILVETDRVSTPGPTPGVDLWWSGKHDNHGGNVQVISAPDGRPIWTSGGASQPRARHHRGAYPQRDPARPGRLPPVTRAPSGI
ncbi:hypothetical protein [Rugosimonospora africana]